MELRQLRYFKAVADARGFVRAAERLRVAQPALSRSIAKLEEEVGRQVFTRHSGGVTLTDAGTLLYEQAERVLRQMQRLKDELAAEADEPFGQVSLGMPPSMQSMLTAPVAAEFVEAYPRASLHLTQNTSANLHQGVLDGSLDLAVITDLIPAQSLRYEPLLKEDVCLVDLAERWAGHTGPLTMADLRQVPLILSGYPNTLRIVIEAAFAEIGCEPLIRCEVNSASLLSEIVSTGAAAGVIPSCGFGPEARHGLRLLPIQGLTVSWSIVTSPARLGSTGVRKLREMLHAWAEARISAGVWTTATYEGKHPHLA